MDLYVLMILSLVTTDPGYAWKEASIQPFIGVTAKQDCNDAGNELMRVSNSNRQGVFTAKPMVAFVCQPRKTK